MAKSQLAPKDYKYGFHDDVKSVFETEKGLTKKVVEAISSIKGEPEWMHNFRIKALEVFQSKPMPTWGNVDLLSQLDFQNIRYYVRPSERTEKNWDEVPEKVKNTFEKLGIPEAERKFLA